MRKKALIAVIAVIVLGLVSFISYYFGHQTAGSNEERININETPPVPSPEISSTEITSTITPATVSATPTSKISVIPRISSPLHLKVIPSPTPTLMIIQISGIKKFQQIPSVTPTPIKYTIVSPVKLQIQP